MLISIASVDDTEGQNIFIVVAGLFELAVFVSKSVLKDLFDTLEWEEVAPLMQGYFICHVLGLAYQAYVIPWELKELVYPVLLSGIAEGILATLSLWRVACGGTEMIERAFMSPMLQGSALMAECKVKSEPTLLCWSEDNQKLKV